MRVESKYRGLPAVEWEASHFEKDELHYSIDIALRPLSGEKNSFHKVQGLKNWIIRVRNIYASSSITHPNWIPIWPDSLDSICINH